MHGVMEQQHSAGESPSCRRPDLNAHVPGYCFGDLSEEQRDRLEAHILECEFCWTEIQRMDGLVRAMRADKSLARLTYVQDIVSAVGLSGKLHRPFGGHWIHVLVVSALYAFLFAETVLMETAYDYDRFASLVRVASPIVFLSIFGSTLLGLWVNWKLTIHHRSVNLLVSAGVLILSSALLYVALRPALPDYSITQASFPTETAQAAYMKGVFRYFLPFGLIMLMAPFNFILAMQRDLAAGQHRRSLGVLIGESHAIPPRGAPYPRFWALCLGLTAGAIYSIMSTAHLLENLTPTPFSNLFIHTIQIRWIAFFAAGLECLGWFYWALSELKRECVAVVRLTEG